ncbi:MAG: hypothetical protein JRE28_00105 [Deltaproteobacteria bacterium]|nr:hypothetical protein [Deltaproteobacteria bacterium]
MNALERISRSVNQWVEYVLFGLGFAMTVVVAVSRRIVPFLALLLMDLLMITFYSPLTMWLARMVAK